MDDRKLGSHALENCVLGVFVVFVVSLFAVYSFLRVAVGSVLVFCLAGWLLKRGVLGVLSWHETRQLRRPEVRLALFREGMAEACEELQRRGLLLPEGKQNEPPKED